MSQPDRKHITEFYDKYVNHQLQNAYNVRHFMLFDELINFGLKEDSNVLELGCGIGVITSMIGTYAHNGMTIGVDISPKSIKAAQKKVTLKNITFFAADILEIDHTSKSFDFITLFDVMEHIPIDKHTNLFEQLAKHVSDDTKVIINIPNPSFIEYLHRHESNKLQVIDQPVWADGLLGSAYKAGFVLKQFRTYDIWTEEDYQLMLFQKKVHYQKIQLETAHLTLRNKIKRLLALD